MVNQNFGNTNFAPQGAKQVKVLGQNLQLSGASLQAGQGTVAIAPGFNPQANTPQEQTVQGQAQIGQSNTPRGAQPVALAGQVAQQASPPQQVPPQQFFQQPSQPPQHLPAPQQAQPAQHFSLGAGEEVHIIEVKGLGRDGREYIAPVQTVFPIGTRIIAVTERVE